MTETYDAIVLGCGGFGSAALYHLAKRGCRVLGLEQFDAVHNRGSSHGQTRIIRQAYFEHPDYVPLLLRAYELWDVLSGEAQRNLLHRVGLFLTGAPDSDAVRGTLQAARQHSLAVDVLSPTEARHRFPFFRFADHFQTVYEPAAGYLDVEDCVETHLQLAQKHGATLRTNEPVLRWEGSANGVRVITEKGTYSAAKLVITAGSWSRQVLKTLDVPLQVLRKVLLWFPVNSSLGDVARGASTFFYDLPEGQFYGFPRLDGMTLKVAEHTGGDRVTDPSHPDCDLKPHDVERVRLFLKTFLPRVEPVPQRHEICYYTMSPDGHFVIDQLPGQPAVTFAAGFSGHGFKFTSVLGEALADLALNGKTALPIGFLGLRRFMTPIDQTCD